MLFYRVEAEVIDIKALQAERSGKDMKAVNIGVELKELAKSDRMHSFTQKFFQLSEKLYHKSRQEYYVFTNSLQGNKICLGIISRAAPDVIELTNKYLSLADVRFRKPLSEEVTLNTMAHMLHSGDRNNFIADDDKILEYFNVYDLVHQGRGRYHDNTHFDEKMIADNLTKYSLVKSSNDILCEETLTSEIERIYEPQVGKAGNGHPVHYLIQTDDNTVREKMRNTLLSALYANGRLAGKRYCEVEIDNADPPTWETYDKLYSSCYGGAIVVTYQTGDGGENEYAKTDAGVVRHLCETMKKHRNKVLTIFCLPRSCEKIVLSFNDYLGSVTLIPLAEDTVFGEKARGYLRKQARKQGVSFDKTLYKDVVKNMEKGYLFADLNRMFDEWYERKLKTHIYPQYAAYESENNKVCKKPIGSAYSDLDKMIGLTEVKSVVKQALDFYKAQRLFKEKGMKSEHTAMHMVFTGNPGTAKTTVARLFAQIMKDNGLLSIGNLYEVGRADLVGRYVGWTAKIVKEKFQDAKGSVLFIDEAYSLVDEKRGLFGDEAINTIVQEMENRREDMIVIFAGYPDKMEQFLQTNPGLRSRIAHHVPFADYDANELYQILELLAEKKDLMLAPDAKEKLVDIYTGAIGQDDFGNGRFARNLLEKAQMKHASRLVAMNVDDVTDEDVRTLIAEDFESLELQLPKQKQVLGFSVS